MPRDYFVYILANTRRGVLYVGMTSNLARRLEQHRAKATPAFTNKYGVVNLVYFEIHADVTRLAFVKESSSAGGGNGNSSWSKTTIQTGAT